MKNLILLAVFSLVLLSCDQTKKEVTYSNIKVDDHISVENKSGIKNGYTLLKENCYICHNPNAKSHDAIIAPPFAAVKWRYNMKYSTSEEFTKALTAFVQEPSIEKALMPGAVQRFNLMTKMTLDTEVLQEIGNYMYKNKLEQPDWFEDHFKEMHGTANKRMGGRN